MTFFGILSQRGHGHAASTILIAMFAMLLTAISYGRMALAYPSAGSGFTYVGREIGPAWGYVTGWSMVLDYLMQPIINVIFCSQQSHVLFPAIPYWLWAILFTLLFSGLNVQGIKMSARFNAVLAAGMGVVVALFFVAASLYVAHHPHDGAGFFTQPFYDPKTWSFPAILSGTSLAVLAYLGFDGISTLSEEAKNPRNVLPATVLTCIAIGLLSVLEVYAAQLVWHSSERFPDIDTAFTSVAGRAWPPLFGVLGFTLIVACIGSGTGMQLGAARLLYGMGRGGALPKSFFGALEARKRIPRNGVLFVGAIAAARCADPAGHCRRRHRIRSGRQHAEFRRADFLHGRQCGSLRALLPARRTKEPAEPGRARARIHCLPAAVVESELPGLDPRRRLDDDRRGGSRVADAGLPPQPGQFRVAAGCSAGDIGSMSRS